MFLCTKLCWVVLPHALCINVSCRQLSGQGFYQVARKMRHPSDEFQAGLLDNGYGENAERPLDDIVPKPTFSLCLPSKACFGEIGSEIISQGVSSNNSALYGTQALSLYNRTTIFLYKTLPARSSASTFTVQTCRKRLQQNFSRARPQAPSLYLRTRYYILRSIQHLAQILRAHPPASTPAVQRKKKGLHEIAGLFTALSRRKKRTK